MKQEVKVQRLAEQIANDLFMNGDGQEAQRLVLMVDSRDLGGWSKRAVIDRITKILEVGQS